MGEIADAMLSGLFDSETGEIIDFEEPGYPRTMSGVDEDHQGKPETRGARKKRIAKARRKRRAARRRARAKESQS